MIANTINNLTNPTECVTVNGTAIAPQQWLVIRHSVTNRYIGRYCPQTNQFEYSDKKITEVVKLPKQ